MAINFPGSPNIGDEYSAAGKTWTWNGSQWEGVPATAGIPYGTTANRPANPELGQPYFNADEARLEMYTTATGWQNIVQETPGIVSVSGVYAESNSSNIITINGTNFAAGAIAYAVGTNGTEIAADLTNLVSVVQVEATFSGLNKAYEPFDIKVVNPSNLYGILYDTLQVDDIPVWITQSGSLGAYVEDSAMSIQISATDEESSNLIFSILSGSLPPGLSLNSATGEISGTPQTLVSNATYSFVLSVTDGNNTATRSFSMTINDRAPVWSTPQTLSAFSKNVAYSQSVSATDDDGLSGYSIFSGSLPTGLSLNTSTGLISGTPTSDATAIFTIRATDVGGNFSDRQFTIPNPGPSWQTSQSMTIFTDTNNIQLSAIDDSGIAPTYSLASGTLPPGVSLSSSGLLSGGSTANDGQVYTFTIRATDNNGEISDREFSATISARIYAFTSHTFTNAGATGKFGPTLSAARSSYNTSWSNTYLTMDYAQGVQEWIVPMSGQYSFNMAGASGGGNTSSNSIGGYGATATFNTALSAGSKLFIVVGQRGIAYNGGQPGGGGGGSYVAISGASGMSDATLIAAIGGGGGTNGVTYTGTDRRAGQAATSGGNGTYNGGSNGSGGSANSSSTESGGGGAGWNSSGANGVTGGGNQGGQGGLFRQAASPFVGGDPREGYNSFGGFGGGGGSVGGGGGGGYSGGGAGQFPDAGGGGGSYIYPSATSASISAGSNSSHGYITITKL